MIKKKQTFLNLLKGPDQSNPKLEAEEKANSNNRNQNPLQYKYKQNNTLMMILVITTTMRIIEVNPEAVDLIDAKILDDFSEAKIHVVEANTLKTHTKANIRVPITKVIITKAVMVYIITTRNYQQGNNYGQFRGRSHGHGRGNYHRCSCGRSNYRGNNNYQYHQYYGHDDDYQSDQYGPPTMCIMWWI